MSNEISCKECGYENPHSSKFCNNCGTKLPLSTHIICPNCATPNTRDRVFCDTCGTRLIAEVTPSKSEEPPAEEPPAPNEPFSLPVRRPGETGELNPNAVPDWLRTGNTGSDAPEEDESTKSSKKEPADLPEWLVHDSDPEPIINAPTTISTEFYNLLEKAEDLPQPDDLFADEEEANLPDWLSDAKEVVADSDSEVGSGLTDWLSDLDDSKPDVTAEATDDSDEAASGGLTDWLHELDDDADPAEDHAAENVAALDNLLDDLPNEENEEAESSDWLAELGPAQTDIIAPQTDELDAESDEELPGWMDELGPPQTNLLDPSQIAKLTGPLAGLDDAIDDEEAGADISFTSLFETASEETETLPDWLDEAAQEDDIFLAELPKETADLADEATLTEQLEELDVVSEADSDWFTADQIVAETDLDWLTETDNLDPVVNDDSLETLSDEAVTDDFLDSVAADADLTIDADGADSDEDAVPASDDDLDWLADMESIRTGKLVVEPEPEPEETAVVQDEPVEPEPEQSEEPPLPEPEEAEWSSEDFFEETAVSQDLPDWMNRLDDSEQLEETAVTAESSDSDSTDEVLPDWIASMRPSEGFIGSELPGISLDADIRDTLEGIPEELAGAELPDWLQGTPIDTAPLTPLAEADGDALDIPDWLQPQADESDTAVSTPSAAADLPESRSSSRDEWRSLLEELPPLTPLAESLPKADIPEWVQQLKPTALSGEPAREPDGPEETAGPLKGMQSIVPIEPVIAKPHDTLSLDSFGITPEQQQQVALLRQITQDTTETVTTLSTKTAYGTAVWLRVVLATLLIVALIIGLRGPNFVASNLPVSANVQAVQTAVSAAAGQPVLVAIEYTPAMAGELSSQAKMLLAQLAANGSPVLITSQYTSGTAVANSLIDGTNAQMVGYLPGESVGLRQLGECLAGRIECRQLNGRLLPDGIQTALPQTQLIIVLTGDRDSLVNWVEQVGSVATDTPVVAGVTQALAPLARSYAATGQLKGLLAGLPDAVAYEQINDSPESGLQAQLNAQIVGQLLAAALLLIGLLVFGTKGVVNKNNT